MRLYTLNPESKGINLSTLLYFDVVESRCCKAQTKLNASFTDFKKFSKSRELNFVTILVLLGIMAFQYISPNQSQGVLTQYAQRQLDINATISINIIGSLVWFALLYAAIRYFQSVINIEKQYNYTHQLESELSETYNGKAFTREGKAYLNNYSIFSGWVHIVYWYIFPILFLKVEVLAAWLSGKMSCSVIVSRFSLCFVLPSWLPSLLFTPVICECFFPGHTFQQDI